jgi:hypothetical protein
MFVHLFVSGAAPMAAAVFLIAAVGLHRLVAAEI